MRTKKNGDPAIPKITWQYLAMQQAKFADSLARLAVAFDVDGPLLKAMQEMVMQHDATADTYERAAAAVAKGRPRVRPKTTRNALEAVALGLALKPKGKPGRPRKTAPET